MPSWYCFEFGLGSSWVMIGANPDHTLIGIEVSQTEWKIPNLYEPNQPNL